MNLPAGRQDTGSDGAAPLADLQAWFQQAIREPGQAALQVQAPQHLQSSIGLSAQARLAIYQRSYSARLLQSFRAIFPGLLRAAGPAMLDAFAVDFLTQHPPHSHSVNRVADGFAAHLAQTRPPREADAPDWADLLVDLARMESALLQVSEAPGLEDVPPADAGAVRQLDDAALLAWQPRPAPCLRLLALAYPVHEYLQSLRGPGNEAPPAEAPPLPEPRPAWLALTRIHYRLHTRELAPVQWQLLRSLDGATPLAAALPRVAALGLRPAPEPALARMWLGNFVAQGFLHAPGP
ncbi:MAG: putative DNA-binding domain-containing protein [Ramlibacter sp.]|nr:putative DNA-binding domain-containing protein [Ramlibacter sp.]